MLAPRSAAFRPRCPGANCSSKPARHRFFGPGPSYPDREVTRVAEIGRPRLPFLAVSGHDQGPLTGDETMLTPLGWAGEVTRQTRIKERLERVAMESNLMVGIDRIDGQPSELEMDGLAQFLDHVLANAIWKRLDRAGASFALDVTVVGPEYLDLKTKKKKRDESHARWAIARTKDRLLVSRELPKPRS